MATNRRPTVVSSSVSVICVTLLALEAATMAAGATMACPSVCVCSTGANGSHVSCEGADLVTIPPVVDLPPKLISIDVSRNSRLGPRLLRVSTDHLERLLKSASLVEFKMRECHLETIEGVFDIGPSSTSVALEDSVGGVKISSSSSLQTLDLSGNRITRLTTGSFRRVSNRLQHLDLSENQLVEIEAGSFRGLRSLVRLELRQNKLTQIDSSTFDGLGPGLRHLRLDDNRITVVDPASFLELERLTYLVLRGNPLGTTTKPSINHGGQNRTRNQHHQHNLNQQLPHHHQHQQHVLRLQFHSTMLSYIDLSECGLTTVPRGLPARSLRYLQLRRNRITSISRADLDDCCTNVTVLVLDENRISALIDSPFTDRHHLRQLWLSGNQLATIPRPLPVALERLFLDANVIDRIEVGDFPVGSRLQTLSLGSNRLGSALAFDALSRLGELKALDLSANELRTVRSKTFAGNRLLESLSLAKNPFNGGELEEGAFDGLDRLETLVISNVLTPQNSADALPPIQTRFYPGTFKGFQGGRLRKLELDGSRGFIRDLLSANASVLEPLGDIDELSMLDADLETVRPDFASIFHSLAVYRVSGTRWRCDRSLIWFRDFLRMVSASSTPGIGRQHHHHHQQQQHQDESSSTVLGVNIGNRCATPPSVRDRSLESLTDAEFEPRDDKDLQRPSPSTTQLESRFRWPMSTAPMSSRQSMTASGVVPTTTPGSAKDGDGEGHAVTFRHNPLIDESSATDRRLVMPATKRVGIVEDSTETSLTTGKTFTPSTTLARAWTSVSVDVVRNSSNIGSGQLSADSQVGSRSKKSQSEENDLTTEVAVRSSSSAIASSAVALIVAPLIVGTVVVASVILTMIVVICRRRHRLESTSDFRKGSDHGRLTEKNLTTGDGRHLRLCVKTSFVGSSPTTTTSVTTEAVVLTSTTRVSGGGELDAAGGRDLIGLIPGRDINHEGPLRVYKWEDF